MTETTIHLLASMVLCGLMGVAGAQFWVTGLAERRTNWVSLIVMAGLIALAALVYG